MNHLQKHFSASRIALAVLLAAAPMGAWAATAPSLGTASTFGALGGAGVTCKSPLPALPAITVTGNVGSLLAAPTSVTGFPPDSPPLCSLSGTVQLGAATAWNDIFGATNSANIALAAQTCDYNHGATEQLGGQTLQSGVHCFPSDALLNGTLNLMGNGPWILRTGTALTTGATSPAMASVLVNGQANCGAGVFWQIGSSATIGSNTAMVGDILAYASISFTGTNSSLVGGAFANTASVTMTGTSITTCGATGGGNGNHGDGHDGDRDEHDKDKDHKDGSRHSFKDGGNPFGHGDNE